MAAHGVDEGAGVGGLGGGGAEGGGEELHGCLDLVAEVAAGVELGAGDEGAEDGFDVAVGGEEGCGHAVDEGGRRVVGDEALGDLPGDEVGGLGPVGEKVEGLEALGMPSLPGAVATSIAVRSGLLAPVGTAHGHVGLVHR